MKSMQLHYDTQDKEKVKKSRNVTVLLVTICRGFQQLTFTGIALFLPLIRKDLGLSFTQGGTISVVNTSIYAFMQIPAGYLTDRFGAKRLFFIGVLGICVLCLTFGLVSEYWQALANQILSGFFRAMIFVPGLVLLTGWFSPDRRATAMGLSSLGVLWGSIVLNIIGPLLVANFGWRFPFLTFAPVGIIASFVFLRFGKESSSTSEHEKTGMHDMLQLFRYPVMWVCAALQFIRLAVVQGISFWLPSLLIDDKGLSLQLTGLLIGIRMILTAPSNLLGGYISDRLRNPILVIGSALIILAITTGLLVVVSNITILILLICINGIFVQIYFGPLFSIPVDILGTRRTGILGGFSNFFANLGSFSFVYLLGKLKDITGSFNSGFYAISVICIIGLAFSILLAYLRRKRIYK